MRTQNDNYVRSCADQVGGNMLVDAHKKPRVLQSKRKKHNLVFFIDNLFFVSSSRSSFSFLLPSPSSSHSLLTTLFQKDNDRERVGALAFSYTENRSMQVEKINRASPLWFFSSSSSFHRHHSCFSPSFVLDSLFCA